MMSFVLETRGLRKHFGGLIAVNDVDFRITPNETVGIIGPNGSGKTTFFNLLSGLFPPTAGTIILFGEEITDLSSNRRVLKGMVRTFQLVSVFNSMTVWENLVLSSLRFRTEPLSEWKFLTVSARSKTVQEDCYRAMEVVGLRGKASAMTSELSYGEKRMLEIGIALSLKPRLLLLDEPLSGLSDLEISELLDILVRVRKDLTLIMIEHKLSKIVNLVDRMCVMNDGSFICEGLPNQVLDDQTVRECYWGKGEMNLEGH